MKSELEMGTETKEVNIDFSCKVFPIIKEYSNGELPDSFCQQVRYYDLKNVDFVTNTDIANLIDHLKSLLEHGVEVQFVNASEKIKSKIKSLGLDHIINCN